MTWRQFAWLAFWLAGWAAALGWWAGDLVDGRPIPTIRVTLWAALPPEPPPFAWPPVLAVSPTETPISYTHADQDSPTPSGQVSAADVGASLAPLAPSAPDTRADAILAVVKGPLAEAADVMVAAADRYAIDWRLIPAIGYWESSAGAAMCAPYNAFGWGCPIGFSSWEMAVEAVARGLMQPPYWNRTISGILAVYNPAGGEEYRAKVMGTMARLEAAR